MFGGCVQNLPFIFTHSKLHCTFCVFILYFLHVIHTQASSTARQKNLLSLRDYMQRCTNELYWLDQQADERIMYDWSDANLDYPARKRQYEVTALAKCVSESCN